SELRYGCQQDFRSSVPGKPHQIDSPMDIGANETAWLHRPSLRRRAGEMVNLVHLIKEQRGADVVLHKVEPWVVTHIRGDLRPVVMAVVKADDLKSLGQQPRTKPPPKETEPA